MEPTSDSATSPKRRRFSAGHPFCNSSDTDVSHHEVPPEKKSIGRLQSTNLFVNDHSDDDDSTVCSNADSNTTHPHCADSNEITFNGTFDDFKIHDADERNKLIAAFKRTMSQFQRGGSDIEEFKEIDKTLQDLRPLNDVVYVYVRFARQPPPNFNTDSLCSLLCVAKQCNMKPQVFLTKVKSLQIRKIIPKFGISFTFVTRNNKEVDGVLLEKKFHGLRYTLSMLQSTVSKAEVVLEKATLPPAGTGDTTIPTKKHSSLFSKLWQGIAHRWLAYHLVDHLFSLNKTKSWTNQEIFVFSIQIFTPCNRSRCDFLNPLVGLCLRFNNHVDINASQSELAPIGQNPKLLYSFGSVCLRNKTSASQIQCIYEAFSSLKKIIQRKTSYGSISLESKWLLLKAYTYHLWLQQSQNDPVKRGVLKMLSQEEKEKSSKAPLEGSFSVKERKKPPPPNTNKSPSPSMPILATTPQGGDGQVGKDNGGLEKLLESRNKTHWPSQTNDGGLQKLLESRNKNPRPSRTNEPCKVSKTLDNLVPRTPNTSQLSDLIRDPNCDWNNLRLLSTHELNEFLASYLIIQRNDGIDVVSRLSALEIYSADNLHDLKHCRLNGNSDFYPKTSVGDVVLNIGNKIEEFLDMASRTYHVAREGSIPFKRHGKFIPTINDIASLCQAVISHGACDAKRCPSQRRAFIGNGGLDLPNGIPTTIVDGGFRKKLTQDPTFCLDRILKTIGRLSEFLWRAMTDMQQCANDLPMALDQFRHSAYSVHLCTLLSMGDCVSFENITLVVSTIYPTTSDVTEHVDVMNDSVPGYTKTGVLNMCFMIDDEKSDNYKLGLHLQVIGTFRRVIRQYLDRAYSNK